MGSVYLARDTQLDRQVALKVPHFTEDDGPEILARFQREARAAATVQHPGICPVYDVGEINGTHYLAMAFIEGQSLKDLVADDQPLPPRQAAEMVCQLALALEEAHRRGIIHRDLKPTNVLLNQRGEPVILDFGLARRTNTESVRLTRTGAVLGTPAYMSPEQVSGDVNAVSTRSDIYSLGVILYELLTGRVPFEGPLAAVVGRLLTEPPEPPSKLRPGLDPRLEKICLQAMAKKPQERFASMADFAVALDEYLQATGGPASSSGVRRPPLRPSSTSTPAIKTPPPGGPSREVRRSKPVPVPQPDWRQAAPQESGGGFTGLVVGLLIALLVGAVLVFLIVRYGSSLLNPDKSDGTPTERKTDVVPGKDNQPLATPVAKQPPPSKLDQGLEALAQSDYAGAISLLTEVLQAEPQNVRALHKRGFAYAQQADYDQALSDLDTALQLEPNNAEALNDRGVVQLNRREYEGALKDLNAALQLNPKYALAQANRGLVYAEQGDYDRARSDCTQAVQLAPKLAAARSNLAYVHLRLRNYEAALEDADRAIQLDPSSARAYRFHGLIHAARGDHDAAIADYGQALRIDPNHIAALDNRAAAYRAKKQYAEAVKDLTEAIRRAPKDMQAYLGLADTHRLMGDFDQAIADCTQALQVLPNRARCHFARGELYAGKKDYDKALEDFTSAIRNEPSYADAYAARGVVLHAQKEDAEALRSFNAALDHDPQSFVARYNRGLLFLDQHKYANALADFDEALKLNPTYPGLAQRRAEALKLSGQR
jgi:serine/threonine protein kinase/Tfp pilus assembly protein PilF